MQNKPRSCPAPIQRSADPAAERTAFVDLGFAARERARKTGEYFSSEQVLQHLERRLAAAKRRQT